MRRARCTALAQGSSLVEADFLDQRDCGLLMCGNLIDWQSIGRDDPISTRIGSRSAVASAGYSSSAAA